MNYSASVSDFFKSPNWMMNMLLGGICVLIPIVGPIVVLGWLITGFWAREDQSFETFPAFDFSNFGKYLERGLWPFLVTFVASIALSFVFVPLIWIAVFCTALIGGGFSSHDNAQAGGCFAVVAMVVTMMVIAATAIAMQFFLVPLKIRASLTQDFAKSFDFRFVKQFIALTWKEMVLSSLFLAIVGTLLVCLGAIVFCVGVYFATVVIYFAWTHLYKQLYALYLSRGGEPIPMSPKLNDSLPVA